MLTSISLFSMIFSTMNTLHGPAAHPEGPTNPFTFIQTLINPGLDHHGDGVYSQEAFDRIISEMMERNPPPSSAPGPASAAAIRGLPSKRIDESMLQGEGENLKSPECAICQDDAELGSEVAVLPCNHWYHRTCVSEWLKQHDTCPSCRKSVMRPAGEQRSQGEQRSGSRRPNVRRSSSVNLPTSPVAEGSSQLPTNLPSNSRDIRAPRQYFEDRSADSARRYSSRPSESNERRRSDQSRTPSNAANSSGVGGWIRNHMPFQ
jgi:E3 ubiquitin-protein ligase RNF115/126